jgi:peptide/nickel transport system substrate-binding protein
MRRHQETTSRLASHGYRSRALPLLVASLVAGLLLAACSSPSTKTGSSQVSTAHRAGSVTLALQPGATPNYIFPFVPSQDLTAANFANLLYLIYTPLYFFGNGAHTGINYSLGLGNKPVVSNGGKTLTITLKHYGWSNGQPVDAQDVAFFWQLLVANKKQFGNYVPDGNHIPDNVTAFRVINSHTVSFTFKRHYNVTWLIYNQLSLIIPMPAQAWDKTSVNGSVGNYAATSAGARRVWAFLNGQAEKLADYASNPLWKVVDGPFRLASFSTDGEATFTPNPSYSGPVKPKITKLVELPFTSAAAEYTSLRSGSVDYGYVPENDLKNEAAIKAEGYRIIPWYVWGVAWNLLNWPNPRDTALFDQLYIRQSLQQLVDQPSYIKDIWEGDAVPSYGPVPIVPASNVASPEERHNPYPYDPRAVARTLTSHGWRVVHGVAQCVRAGGGAGRCGAGIPAGKRLVFNLYYPSGISQLQDEYEAYKSVAGSVGIDIVLHQVPSNSAAELNSPCVAKSGKNCQWDLLSLGSPSIIYDPDNYPTGGVVFSCGGGFNGGGYCNKTANSLIAATHDESGLGAMHAYEDFVERQLPVTFFPTAPYQVSAISHRLHGASAQNPYVYIEPQYWSLGG